MFTSDDVAFVHTLALIEQMGEALRVADEILGRNGITRGEVTAALAAYEAGPQP